MDDELKVQITEVIKAHKELVAELQERCVDTITEAAKAIVNALRRNGTVYTCGNGGSAADAQHVASELTGKFERERQPLRAIALTTDTSVMTSIANDYGYELVFAKQVEALVREGDILWAFSTSGSSSNILAAVELANKKRACVLAFTGRPDSKLEKIADICLCANTPSTARSQEIHQVAYHIICGLVEDRCCEKTQ